MRIIVNDRKYTGTAAAVLNLLAKEDFHAKGRREYKINISRRLRILGVEHDLNVTSPLAFLNELNELGLITILKEGE